nr:hypothetical protein [Planctomycetota bacterium]
MTVNNSVIIFLLAAMVILSGCQRPLAQQEPLCPGKATVRQAATVIRLQKQKAQPIMDSADCIMSWRDEKG